MASKIIIEIEEHGMDVTTNPIIDCPDDAGHIERGLAQGLYIALSSILPQVTKIAEELVAGVGVEGGEEKGGDHAKKH